MFGDNLLASPPATLQATTTATSITARILEAPTAVISTPPADEGSRKGPTTRNAIRRITSTTARQSDVLRRLRMTIGSLPTSKRCARAYPVVRYSACTATQETTPPPPSTSASASTFVNHPLTVHPRCAQVTTRYKGSSVQVLQYNLIHHNHAQTAPSNLIHPLRPQQGTLRRP
ncbi:hypothetical protein RJ55_07877 [Drechmeria coniospora]|nr:hypothetical protein RJ55_07877 [Drechmeria coniospora]